MSRKTSTLSSLKAEVLAYGDLYLKHNSSTLSERNEMGHIKKLKVPSFPLRCIELFMMAHLQC